MKSNLCFKCLLLAFISIVLTMPLIAQTPDKEVATFSKKKKGVFEQPIWKKKKTKFAADKDLPARGDDSQLYQSANYPDWKQYARAHLTYPTLAQENFVEGTVYAEVEITALGAVASVKIIRGLGFGCDEAVINLLRNMPPWEPCLKKGLPRNQTVCIPVKFSLM